VLISTGSFPDPDSWNNDFNSLSPELIDDLATKGVKLLGIDTPSVDPADSKGLESHQAIFRHDLCVLEGLILNRVPAGRYTLVALPLRLKDADASPVRAILMEPDKL
jgi:arylformamidase